jgi:protease-4
MNHDDERSLLLEAAQYYLKDKKSERFWRWLMRLTWIMLLLFVGMRIFNASQGLPADVDTNNPIQQLNTHTAVVQFHGVIDTDNDPGTKLIQGLNAALADKRTKAIIIDANSPGGSPVLSDIAYNEILRLRALHPTIPIYTVVLDVCASGCYYMASATEKIFVSPASIIGSIGVVSGGFGFDELIKKWGIERRIQTAGTNKAGEDPFSPRTSESIALKQTLLDAIHQQFIHAVKTGRGQRLQDDDDTFSGRVWIGQQAIPLGIADAFGSVDSVARDIIKHPKTVDFTPRDLLDKRLAKYLGASLASQVQLMLSNDHLH